MYLSLDAWSPHLLGDEAGQVPGNLIVIGTLVDCSMACRKLGTSLVSAWRKEPPSCTMAVTLALHAVYIRIAYFPGAMGPGGLIVSKVNRLQSVNDRGGPGGHTTL